MHHDVPQCDCCARFAVTLEGLVRDALNLTAIFCLHAACCVHGREQGGSFEAGFSCQCATDQGSESGQALQVRNHMIQAWGQVLGDLTQ